jgi:hypothetical protein
MGGNGGLGGNGAPGGGCIVLSARGLVRVANPINISAGSPDPGAAGNNGSAETGLLSTANWNIGGNFYTTAGSAGSFGAPDAGRGGPGGTGGVGGKGGNGGTPGKGGKGGDGGHGKPGMLKLIGTVIEASDATVLCENYQPSTDPLKTGHVSYISNMTPAALAASVPTFNDAATVGSATFNDLLTTTSFYDVSVIAPLMPTLEGGPAAAGICLPAYYNHAAVDTQVSGSPAQPIVLVRLGGTFTNFDQVFLVNTTASVQPGVKLQVNGNIINIPDIPANRTWVMGARADATVNLLSSSRVEGYELYN